MNWKTASRKVREWFNDFRSIVQLKTKLEAQQIGRMKAEGFIITLQDNLKQVSADLATHMRYNKKLKTQLQRMTERHTMLIAAHQQLKERTGDHG